MSHSRSSANWFVGAISEDQGVAERAASLPGRVCLNDLHIVHGAVLGVCFHHSNLIHHAYTLTHTAKNGMLAIKPLGGSQGHKEPAAVGVRPCIGHCENSSPCEFQVWIKFIFKLLAIDRRTTSTCQLEDGKPVSQSHIPPHNKNYGPGPKDCLEYGKGRSPCTPSRPPSTLQPHSPAAESSTDTAHSNHQFHLGRTFLFKITLVFFFPAY